MVKNDYCKCDYCGCKIRLRYQIGYSNIPLNIYCPICNSHISGTIEIDYKNTGIFPKFIGLSKTESEEYDYVIELATEFLVEKTQKHSSDTDYALSPFLRSGPFNEERLFKRQRLVDFSKSANNLCNFIENIYNLLKDEQISLIKDYLLNKNDPILDDLKQKTDFRNISNIVDALLATKHYLNCLLIPIMPPNCFNKMYSIMDTVTRRITNNHIIDLKIYLSMLSVDYFETYFYRIPKFFVDYIKCVCQLIPIYDVYHDFENINQTKIGISTIDVDELVVVYKKGYELLCDSIDLLVGLYNIDEHGAYNNFGTGQEDFEHKLNSFNSKYSKYVYVTTNTSDIFDGIRNVLNNAIRNAEGHNSIYIDGLNQKIKFKNKHKGRVTECEKTFLTFGKECIDLFAAILYVWEYYYQFIKLKSVLIDGIKLNYGVKNQE